MNLEISSAQLSPTPIVARPLTNRDTPAFARLYQREPNRFLTPRLRIYFKSRIHPKIEAFSTSE